MVDRRPGLRVLVQLRYRPSLALAARRRRAVASEDLSHLAGLDIDRSYPPVLLPSPVAGEPGSFTTAPEQATYLLRGNLTDPAAPAARHPEVLGVFPDLVIQSFPTCTSDPPVGTAADVAEALAVTELAAGGMDGHGVALAVVDSGMNVTELERLGRAPHLDAAGSWTPALASTQPGKHPVGHGTMCAFDAGIAAPEATLLDYAVLLSPRSGTSGVQGLLSDAVLAYSHLLAQMQALPAGCQSLVVTNSWGLFSPASDARVGSASNYSDNPTHPFNVIVASLVNAGADVVFAAGNCGRDCPDPRCGFGDLPPICGANSHPRVICVAGVDVRRRRVGYSSQGPGRLSPEKPDVCAFTHFTGSGVYGAHPDAGTSAACPVAAGVIAAVRSRHPPGSVAADQLRELVQRTADPPDGQGFNFDHGWGTINARRLAAELDRLDRDGRPSATAG